jgi:hypothetical protein
MQKKLLLSLPNSPDTSKCEAVTPNSINHKRGFNCGHLARDWNIRGVSALTKTSSSR